MAQDKFTVKELKEMTGEKLFAEYVRTCESMAKEQKFPAWRVKYENQILTVFCEKTGLNIETIKSIMGVTI